MNNDKINKRKESFIYKAKKIHGDKYDYSKVNYVNSKAKICIICPKHGEFWQTPAHHLSGEGCRKCGYEKLSKDQISNTNEFIEKAKKIHENIYDYSKFVYNGNKRKGIIICPIHGEFEMIPNAHLRGAGCPKCGAIKAAEKISLTKEEFIRRSNDQHKGKYDYSKVNYVNNKVPVEIICPVHGLFYQRPDYHLRGCGCPKCSNPISKWEKEICQFLKDNGIKYEESNRTILNDLEIDIFLPDYNVGIECDGLYWHSDKFRDENYHLRKTLLSHIKGIRLIHIFEDEWIFKKDIVKSMLMNILDKTPIRIYARKCQIKDINEDIVKDFNNANNIQNEIAGDVNLGLFYNDDLVMCVSFKKNDTNWEITSLCSKLNTEIIGGISKLLDHFMAKFKPKEMIIFSDRRWSVDNTFEKIGFICKGNLKPNYFYIIGKHREKDNFNLSNQIDFDILPQLKRWNS